MAFVGARLSGTRSSWLALPLALLTAVPLFAQAPDATRDTRKSPPALQPSASSPAPQPVMPQAKGTIRGTVVYSDGSVVVGAQIAVSSGKPSTTQQVLSNSDGQFSFANVAPGAFQITVTASGFTEQSVNATLEPGQDYVAAPVTLVLSPNITSIQVVAPTTDIAAAQVKAEETQRVLGVIPNFYVSYFPDAAPLNAKQKYQLAWKSTIDPVTFGLVAAIAGVEQAEGSFREYGQGAEGYGKRYGAAYADTVTGNFLGGAVFPALFRQDPRYFYKGVGSTRSRLLYAIAMAVICRGDDKRWQFNYSGIMGGMAAGSISTLYYPQNHNGTALIFENTLIGIGASAGANIIQEFFIRKLTPNLPRLSPNRS